MNPLGLLAEHQIGRWRVFVNAENPTDVRQTRRDPDGWDLQISNKTKKG